jgi:hypothetical protein
MSYLVNLTAISPRVRFSGSMTRDPEFPQIIMGGGITGKSHSFDFNLFCKFVSAYSNARFADPPIPQPLGDFNSFNLNVRAPSRQRRMDSDLSGDNESRRLQVFDGCRIPRLEGGFNLESARAFDAFAGLLEAAVQFDRFYFFSIGYPAFFHC